MDEYVINTATLRLKHQVSSSDTPKIANVNIEHLLESIKRNETEIGSWLNVIGYVERRKEKGIYVQAVAVWDAGNVDVNAYQEAVEKRKVAA